MRFVFTLNLPTFKNNLVQEVVGEYPAKTLHEIRAHIAAGQTWFLVEQFYITGDNGGGRKEWKSRGEILLNTAVIGKIKMFVENDRD